MPCYATGLGHCFVQPSISFVQVLERLVVFWIFDLYLYSTGLSFVLAASCGRGGGDRVKHSMFSIFA